METVPALGPFLPSCFLVSPSLRQKVVEIGDEVWDGRGSGGMTLDIWELRFGHGYLELEYILFQCNIQKFYLIVVQKKDFKYSCHRAVHI